MRDTPTCSSNKGELSGRENFVVTIGKPSWQGGACRELLGRSDPSVSERLAARSLPYSLPQVADTPQEGLHEQPHHDRRSEPRPPDLREQPNHLDVG